MPLGSNGLSVYLLINIDIFTLNDCKLNPKDVEIKEWGLIIIKSLDNSEEGRCFYSYAAMNNQESCNYYYYI